MKKIICLWSCPRNISTALMYSFAQRKDTQIFDEPLYAHYLKISGKKHPAREEILQSQNSNGNKVVNEIILNNNNNILFHKLMTHFLVDIDTSFLSEVINIIFIRNPKEIIESYSKVISNPKMNDIGIKHQYNLYLLLKKRNIEPLVLDSKYLLMNPKVILKKLCDILRIEFDQAMLGWKKGGRKEDGIWSRYWYANVHSSTGFMPYTKRTISLEGSNARLARECLPYYQFLTKKSINTDAKI